MSYKYDPENGYRNADQIGADTEEFNPELYNIIQAIKKTKDTRTAINMLSAYIREINGYEKFVEENETMGKETVEKEDNLVSKIENDMKSEELEERE